MAEFFVTKTATEEGHMVHKTTCGHLPASTELMYIGSYASADAAYRIATGYFNQVGFCTDCMPSQ